jgi:hypothetical protein
MDWTTCLPVSHQLVGELTDRLQWGHLEAPIYHTVLCQHWVGRPFVRGQLLGWCPSGHVRVHVVRRLFRQSDTMPVIPHPGYCESYFINWNVRIFCSGVFIPALESFVVCLPFSRPSHGFMLIKQCHPFSYEPGVHTSSHAKVLPSQYGGFGMWRLWEIISPG